MKFQAISRAKNCTIRPDILYSRLVENPTLEDSWTFYFNCNKSELFAKGFMRYATFIGLISTHPKVVLGSKECPSREEEEILQTIEQITIHSSLKKTFIQACLIIVLQPFGDGNHRTAEEFFKMITEMESLTQNPLFSHDGTVRKIVDTLIVDYGCLCAEPKMLCEIYYKLSKIFEENKNYYEA